MNAKDAIRQTLQLSQMVLRRYLEDLTDAELFQRPGPGCNHLAWQLGHLISAESQLVEFLRPGAGVPLPQGFAEQHSKETAGSDDASQFRTKQQYLELFDQANRATLALLEQFSESELDQPGPEQLQPMLPTIGSVFLLIATHPLMHAGQFVPVRRALGKPVVI